VNGRKLLHQSRKAVLAIFRDLLRPIPGQDPKSPFELSNDAHLDPTRVALNITVCSQHAGRKQSLSISPGRYLYREVRLERVDVTQLIESSDAQLERNAAMEVDAVSADAPNQVFLISLITDSVFDHCLRIQSLKVLSTTRAKAIGASNHLALFRCDAGELHVNDGVWKIDDEPIPGDPSHAGQFVQKIINCPLNTRILLGIVMENPLH
jgi:hypothetical protein